MSEQRQAKVAREPGRVWIKGVQGFDSGQYASSPHGCQAAILATIGESLTYDDLVCYGGFAFRIGVHNGMCPSAGHPCCGYMCIERSNRILPWRVKSYRCAPWEKPRADEGAFKDEVREAVVASIERGVPVHYGSEEDGIIVGYVDGGWPWLCLHPYHKLGREIFRHDEVKGFAGGEWPWNVSVWQEPKGEEDRADLRAALIGAMQQAVDMWRTEKKEDYFCGDAAYGFWLSWLRGVEAGTVEDPKGGMQGNGWGYDVLLHGRSIANRWLRLQAEGLAGEARAQLLVAADHYDAMANELIAGLKCPWDLALPPHRFGDWTSTLRQDQIRRLESAREHDRAAIAAIDKALAAIEPYPG